VTLAVGVDVAARRGCDVVALDDERVARVVGRAWSPETLRQLLRSERPDVVAIDAPPRWAPSGRSRTAERELLRRGIAVFCTPDEAGGVSNSFYQWMETGIEMHAAAADFATLEVFPHASAVAIRGRLPARGVMRRVSTKHRWRVAALLEAGIDPHALRTIDEVDAALAAFTGLAHLNGGTIAVGDPCEGVIVLPTLHLPDRYAREGLNTP
jgi:predicted nuclease with RNAse H fold